LTSNEAKGNMQALMLQRWKYFKNGNHVFNEPLCMRKN
jgi:hypothetical protein